MVPVLNFFYLCPQIKKKITTRTIRATVPQLCLKSLYHFKVCSKEKINDQGEDLKIELNREKKTNLGLKRKGKKINAFLAFASKTIN